MGEDDNAAVVFANIARDLAAQTSEQAVLERVVALATQVLAGCDEAGVLLLHNKRDVDTATGTGALVYESDAAQSRLEEGPCFDAALGTDPWRNRVYRSDDTAHEQRWPSYTPRAREIGIASMLGFQLYASDTVFGALDLYSRQPHAFSEATLNYGWVFASHAAVALTSARTEGQLRTAVDTRSEIGQALGILMERYHLSTKAAFNVLQRASQHTHTKLHELAAQLVRTGQLPDVSNPGSE